MKFIKLYQPTAVFVRYQGMVGLRDRGFDHDLERRISLYRCFSRVEGRPRTADAVLEFQRRDTQLQAWQIVVGCAQILSGALVGQYLPRPSR